MDDRGTCGGAFGAGVDADDDVGGDGAGPEGGSPIDSGDGARRSSAVPGAASPNDGIPGGIAMAEESPVTDRDCSTGGG